MIGNTGELSEGLVDVFGANANALLFVAGERLGIEGNVELFFIGGAKEAISLDAGA